LKAVSELGGKGGEILSGLVQATGRVDHALEVLPSLILPANAAAERDRLVEVVGLVREALPDLSLTVDPVEHRGFEYQTGLSFAIFGAGVRGELGRGGRYRSVFSEDPATGFSLYLDTVLRGLPKPKELESIMVPSGVSPATRKELRDSGWMVVMSLEADSNVEPEARRLGCTHVWIDGKAVLLEQPRVSEGEAS